MSVFFFVPLSLPPASNAPGVWFLYARRACTRATVRHHKTRGGQTMEQKKSTVSVLGEELVDWIARQGPKLYRAWAEAGAL